MTSKLEFVNKIKDLTISDETIFKMIHEYVADRSDASGNLRAVSEGMLKEFEELSDLLYQARPQVMEKLRQEVVEDHKDCCCEKDPG